MKSIPFPDTGSDQELANPSLNAEDDGLPQDDQRAPAGLPNRPADSDNRGKKLEP